MPRGFKCGISGCKTSDGIPNFKPGLRGLILVLQCIRAMAVWLLMPPGLV